MSAIGAKIKIVLNFVRYGYKIIQVGRCLKARALILGTTASAACGQ
jgi:hypothetical protein